LCRQYDVLIVGAGVAGSALAHALSTITSKLRALPLRIALLEHSLAEPDRIVGELLQPTGVAALQKLGLESCLEGIDAIPEHGYCVVQSGRVIHIPYPDGRQGRSFHHSRFIMALRERARWASGVDVVEATVNELIEEPFFADPITIADGCFSNFRNTVIGKALRESSMRSRFCGVILKSTRLPIPQHSTVGLVKGHGPVLLYQILEHDTHMLVAVKHPVPHVLKGHIFRDVVPQLPASLHVSIHEALDKDRIRCMPNSVLPAVEQGGKYTREGVILHGDAWHMHHPLTGSSMNVALHAIVILSKLLAKVNIRNQDQMSSLLSTWYCCFASTINILSFALYDLFGADGLRNLAVLRTGCFKYFEHGGEYVIATSPSLLAYHFFAPLMVSPHLWEYPGLAVRDVKVLLTAYVVFGPLLWSEIRWW
ncbi:squalene epoxidase-domain-containing protein, partial [Pisolithus marmoratus]